MVRQLKTGELCFPGYSGSPQFIIFIEPFKVDLQDTPLDDLVNLIPAVEDLTIGSVAKLDGFQNGIDLQSQAL